MGIAWQSPSETETFHHSLDPVSAWLFSQSSPFLRSGDAVGDAAMLYAMPLDGGGFDPAVSDMWRALSIPNPIEETEVNAEHPFSVAAVEPLLGPQAHEIPDPRLFVLPLPSDAPRDSDTLLRPIRLGSPFVSNQDALSIKPKAVIGIIDHGINIFHHRFRAGETGSRVAFAWMQGEPRLSNGRIRYGREWTRREIVAAQEAAGSDEDMLLRQIGVDYERPGFRPLGFRVSHGTHVLDLAAGMDPDDPRVEDYLIIAVSLPPEVTRETSGSMLAIPFVMGLEYIADRARILMQGDVGVFPVFVNFSFGLSGGPRNGMHRLERSLATIASRHQEAVATSDTINLAPGEAAPFTVAIAAGNNNLAQGHAATHGTNQIDLRWHIPPADRTSNILEIRVAHAEDESVDALTCTLSLTPPGGATPAVEEMSARSERPDQVRVLTLGQSRIGQATLSPPQQGISQLTLVLAPTDNGLEGGAVAPAGEWQVTLRIQVPVPLRLDAWILRDDVPGGFRDTGRQSYFVDDSYIQRDQAGRVQFVDDPTNSSAVQRDGTLNAVATATSNVALQVVGSLIGPPERARVAPYSATPLTENNESVDFSAISDRSPVTQGILAAGTRSGTKVPISGTSVAAPQLIRHLAMGEGRLVDTPDAVSSAGATFVNRADREP